MKCLSSNERRLVDGWVQTRGSTQMLLFEAVETPCSLLQLKSNTAKLDHYVTAWKMPCRQHWCRTIDLSPINMTKSGRAIEGAD